LIIDEDGIRYRSELAKICGSEEGEDVDEHFFRNKIEG